MTERVLVTGAAGFVGRRVLAALAARGRPYLAVEHRWTGASELGRLLEGAEVARCIHLGWDVGYAGYRTDAVRNQGCVERSLELASWLVDAGVRHVVVAGTSAEYADVDGRLDEAAPIAPRCAYGEAKARLHEALRNVDPLTVAWARPFQVVGPGDHPERGVAGVVRAMAAGERIPATDGAQLRDFVDVDDVAAALVLMSERELEGPFNVCGGRPTSVRELFEALAAATGLPAEQLCFGERELPEFEPRSAVGASDRLREHGWRPTHDFDDIVQRLVTHTRAVSASS